MSVDEPEMRIPYLKLHKILMTCFGIWPYNSRLVNHSICGFYIVFSVSTMIPLNLGLVDNSNDDIITMFETLVGGVMIIGGFTQVTMLGIRNHLVKYMYKKISADWLALTDVREIEILSTFSYEGRALTLLFILITITSYILFVALTYIPLINDKVASWDYSRIFPYYSKDWIINEHMRHLQVLLHGCLGIFYGGVAYIVTIALYVCSLKHICGMYAIIGYRLKKLTTSCEITQSGGLRDEVVLPKMHAIISQHREAIEEVRLLQRLFGKYFFVLQLYLLMSLAFLIFGIQYNIHNTKIMFRIFLASIILVIQVFYMNYGGEQILHYSSKIHSDTYCMQWYMLSVKSRKILLMIIQRSCKSEQLSAGIMTLSLANFTTIIKASWSMATVLMSAHRKY